MAIEQVNSSDYDYDKILATTEVSYVGKADITISEYDTDAACVVKVGSKFENNGALFKVLTADETPTGYSGIANSTTFYLYWDADPGTAFIFSSVAPTWSDAFQGWYNGNDRAFFSMYKDSGGTLYEDKYVLLQKNGTQLNTITFRGTVKYKKYFKDADILENALFTELATWVSSTGDALSCVGSLAATPAATINYYITGLYRFSSTQVQINVITAATAAVTSIGIDSTDGSTDWGIEIMSNFDVVIV